MKSTLQAACCFFACVAVPVSAQEFGLNEDQLVHAGAVATGLDAREPRAVAIDERNWSFWVGP